MARPAYTLDLPKVIDITNPSSWPHTLTDPSSTFADADNPTKAELAAAIDDFKAEAGNAGKNVVMVDNRGNVVSQFDGANEARPGGTPIDRADVKSYFDEQWADNYATYVAEATAAWQDAGGNSYAQTHGSKILPPANLVVEATQDGDLLDDLIDLIDLAMANATESPPDGGGNFDAGYYGWTTNSNVSAYSENLWAAGAAKVCESIALGRSPASTTDKNAGELQTWAEDTLDWLEHNIIDKWWEQASSSLQRYNANNYTNGAIAEPPTNSWQEFTAVIIDLGLTMRSALAEYSKTTVAFAGSSGTYNDPDVWLETFLNTPASVFIDGDGCLQWDVGNTNVPEFSTPDYDNWPTNSTNKWSQMMMRDFHRRGYLGIPRHFIEAMAKTVTHRMWNRKLGDALLINNYQTGVIGHDYSGGNHATSGAEGYGWIYDGHCLFGRVDPTVKMITAELLALVRRVTNVSATYERHNAVVGRLGLAAGLLWCDTFEE